MRLSQRNIDVGQRIISLFLTQHKEGVIENAIDCQSELYSHCALKQYPSLAHATQCRLCRNLRSPTPMVESEHEHEYISAHRSLSSFLFSYTSISPSLTHPHPQSSRPKSNQNPKQSQASAGKTIPKTSSHQTKPNPIQNNLKNGPLRRLGS